MAAVNSGKARDLVLHIVQSLNFGGIESRMKIVALNYNASTYDHRFCAIANGGAIADELIAAGAVVAVLNRGSRIPSFPAILALIRHIRAERPAILHCHGAEANFHGLIAGYICNVPVCVAEEIGFPGHSIKARLIFRQVYKLADSVVAISEAVRRKMLELGEISSKQCQVILNPAQMQRQRAGAAASDHFEVGFVGRLEEIKNPLGLVRAAALLRDSGLAIRVTIIGDGSQRKLIEQEVKKLQLSEVVVMTGFNARPFERLKGVALYVQPSISEGFGLALVEAMSMGIPVLATAVGGTPEIITDGENGWLFSGTDPHEIADGIAKRAALGSAALDGVGRLGRKSVVERFSPAAYFAACDSLYTSLLTGSRL